MSVKKFFTRLFFYDSWAIAVREFNNDSLLFDFENNEPFRIVNFPKGFWGADPFVFEKDNKVFLFFEYTNMKKGKSFLASTQIFPDIHDKPHVIYEFKGHTSYPCIFEHNGNLYIIPETIDSKNVYLLRCVEWPYIWKNDGIILKDFECVDSTIAYVDKRLCVFLYTIEKRDLPSNSRKLYIADFDIDNKKICNIKMVKEYKTKDGRPGGHCLYLNGKMYRTVQPGNKFYGEKIEFSEFCFEKNEYRENLVAEIKPSNIKLNCNIPFKGIHTYNRSLHYEVIDLALNRKFDLFKLIKYIFGKFGIFGFDIAEKKKKMILSSKK